jgi:hypothetical protein
MLVSLWGKPLTDLFEDLCKLTLVELSDGQVDVFGARGSRAAWAIVTPGVRELACPGPACSSVETALSAMVPYESGFL